MLERTSPVLQLQGFSVHARERTVLAGIDLALAEHELLTLIGPSGVGKSTLLRSLNRLVETTPGLSTEGELLFHGEPAHHLRADQLRRRVGMLFQQPVLFPGNVFDNVVFGVRRLGTKRSELPQVAELALREAQLWEEVKDRLREPAQRLSVGQAQRLCLARVLAGRPEVILMDEPTSALDPRSTRAIEGLVQELVQRHTVVLVTHDLRQARRVATRVGCMLSTDGVGRLVECSRDLLEQPRSERVAAYLSAGG